MPMSDSKMLLFDGLYGRVVKVCLSRNISDAISRFSQLC